MPNNKSKGGVAALGVAALAAAAAGAYYFYGNKQSSRHRRKMKSWILKAQGEVMERVEQMKDLSKDAYEKAIGEVMDKYKKIKTIPPQELESIRKEMQGHWNNLSRHFMKPAAKSKPRSKAKTKN